MPDTTPTQPAASQKAPEIHVIPEQFYGVAGKAKLKPVKEKHAEVAKAPTPAPAGMEGVASQKIVKPKPASKKWILIPILALLFIGGLGIGTWFLLKPPAAPQEAVQPTTSIQPPPVSEPEPEPTPEPEPEPVPVLLPSDDEDNDGLTRIEEELFGTSDESTDSDQDGFTDLLEVVNLYNPAGFTPTRLDEAGLVLRYAPENAYEILYPSSWTITTQEDGSVLFSDAEGMDAVTITAEPNQEGQTLLDWFVNKNPLVPTTRIQESTTKAGDTFLSVSGDLMSYLLGDGVVYMIALKDKDALLKYQATYRMMVNSFVLTP